MRALICFCLATGLWGGESPRPGLDLTFVTRILADTEGGTRPWQTFRSPAESASAVVEVVGELTQDELRQVVFQEFLDWFRMELQRFWLNRGSVAPAANWAAATLPVDRFGGNPVPRTVTLGRIGN